VPLIAGKTVTREIRRVATKVKVFIDMPLCVVYEPSKVQSIGVRKLIYKKLRSLSKAANLLLMAQ